MTTGKKIIATLIVIALGVLTLILIQNYSQNRANDAIAGPDLTNGLLTEPENNRLVPEERVFDFGVDVPEITEPAFVSIAEADEYTADLLPGIALEIEGQDYFFGYQVMNWHQLVNLDVNGQNLAVTFDPLCYAPRVYDQSGLSHSNQVYDNNALLTDSNGNLWSQSRGLAVVGNETGNELDSYPYENITWKTWAELHPDGLALAPPEDGLGDYTRHPYGAYDENDIIYFPLSTVTSTFNDKWVNDVFESFVFMREIEKGFGVYNFESNEVAYVAFYDFDQQRTRVFEARTDGSGDLTFTYDFDSSELSDELTGTTWNAAGLAIDGDLEGAQLVEHQTRQSFWMCTATEIDEPNIAHSDNIDFNEFEDEPTPVDVQIGN